MTNPLPQFVSIIDPSVKIVAPSFVLEWFTLFTKYGDGILEHLSLGFNASGIWLCVSFSHLLKWPFGAGIRLKSFVMKLCNVFNETSCK